MTVEVNGRTQSLRDGATVADALAAVGVEESRGVAVAVGGEVVPRNEWPARRLAAGDSVEVVRAVQGG